MTATTPPSGTLSAVLRGVAADLRQRWVTYLSYLGAAAILVGAFGPFPVVLELGPGKTQTLQFVAMLVFAERLFGGELRDYVVGGWMTWNLTASLVVLLQDPHMAAGEAFLRQFAGFVAGGLLVRWMKTYEPDLITEELSSATLRMARDEGLPLAEAVQSMPHLAEGLMLLEARLADSSLPSLFGLPARVDLRQELAHLRVRQASLNMFTNLLFSASYLPFNRTMEVNVRSRTPRVVAHELLHALHHKAVMRALTRRDLERVLTKVDKSRSAEFIDETIDRVRGFLDAEPLADLSESVRWDGADLIFYFKLLDKAPMEAVGSYFDGVGVDSVGRYVEKLVYYLVLPFAVLAGMDRTNGIYQSFAGYLNEDYVEDMGRRGLVSALLEPREF